MTQKHQTSPASKFNWASANLGGGSDRARRLLPAIILITLALAAYSSSFKGSFVLDDRPQILNSPALHSGGPYGQFLIGGMRPVPSATIIANYWLGGTSVRGYHMVNLAVHILAALTLLGIVRRTFDRPTMPPAIASASAGLALAIAAIWLVHPLATQSVTYIIQRAESMMGLFYLLMLYCVIRGFDASSDRQAAAATWWNVAAVVACGLGMGCKQVMATAPLMVLVYDRLFLSRAWRPMLRRWPLYAGLAATWLIVATLMAVSPPGPTAGFGVSSVTPMQYAVTQLGVIVHYLRLSVWPAGLCFDTYWPVARGVGEILPPALAIAALLGVTAWLIVRGRSGWGFLGVWFFLILAPTSSIMPIMDRAAEHRMYLSLIAVVVAGVVGVFLLAQKIAGVRGPGDSAEVNRVLAVGAALLAGGLAWLTFERNKTYQDETALWQDVLRCNPGNARAHVSIGALLQNQGRHQEAATEFLQALQINPAYPLAHYNLGRSFDELQKRDDAMYHYRAAIELNPDYADARVSVAIHLVMQGQVGPAIEQFKKAMAIQPDDPLIRTQLGHSLILNGQRAEAIEQLKIALAIVPDLLLAQRDLAWTYATLPVEQGGSGPAAIRLAERANQLTAYKVPMLLDTLAAAYAQDGRWPQAQQVEQKALELSKTPGLSADIAARLEMYRRHEPCRHAIPPGPSDKPAMATASAPAGE